MKHSKFLWYLLVFAMLFAACSKDDDDDDTPATVNESEVLVKYMESPDSPLGKDYVNSDLPSIISAEAVHNDVVAGAEIYIIDIRSDVDFGNGHIEGAVNKGATSVMGYLEDEGIGMDKKIVIVCYTGQTAGWLTSLLRLSGYSNAFSMLWGMSSWHSDCAVKWQNSISNLYATQFEDEAVAKGDKGSMPKLSTGKTSGQDIFDARITALMAEGFDAAKITNAAVFDNPSNYYVVNYWAEPDYTHYGHVPGAMQYTPKESMAYDVDLTTLPTDKTIVVYCWTGQTSAYLTAYLRLLGYDAKSLLFGANGMIYDELESHKWSDANIMDYEMVP